MQFFSPEVFIHSLSVSLLYVNTSKNLHCYILYVVTAAAISRGIYIREPSASQQSTEVRLFIDLLNFETVVMLEAWTSLWQC